LLRICPSIGRLNAGRIAGNSSRTCLLKALTEESPIIRRGAGRHLPSDDGQMLRNLRSHPMTAADFRRIARSLEGVEEYPHAGLPAFRVGGRKFASLASQAEGYGNLMLTLEQQAAFVEEAPRFSCRFQVAGERWDTLIFAWRRRARMY
jgi:hypothetical protein